jgi:hypothetical protein
VAKTARHAEHPETYELSFRPPLVLSNLLPVETDVEILSGEESLTNVRLLPGEDEPVYCFQPSSGEYSLAVKLPQFHWSTRLDLSPFLFAIPGQPGRARLKLLDHANLPLYIEVEWDPAFRALQVLYSVRSAEGYYVFYLVQLIGGI